MKRRRLLSLAMGVAMALVALELALQVGAFVIWRSKREPGEGAILCVGDSFTYGLGATSDGGSYPRQLEAVLRARGATVSVVNAGWPGQSSREVLLRLPQQLALHRPRTVCLLVGINDPVVRPALVREPELAAPPTGFPLRPRLLQVFAMMADWLRNKTPATRPFVGVWHAGDLEVTFERDGRVLLGKDEVRWLEDENGVVLLLPQGAQPMTWQLADERLTVRTPSFTHVLQRGPAPAPSALVRSSKALANGQVAAAKQMLHEAVSVAADAASAREALLRIAVQEGDAPARARWLAELRAGDAQSPDAMAGAALAQALAVAGEVNEALEVAERVLETHPDNLRAWDVLLQSGLGAGARDRVLACMQRVLASAAGDEGWRPSLLQMRASLRQAQEPVPALLDLFAAFVQNGDRAFLQRQLELGAAAYTPTARQAALAQLAPDMAARVREALQHDAGETGVLATLRAHLERAIALCRQRGAEVWLLSYPEPDAARDPLVAGIAAGSGVHFLPLHPHFTALLATTPRAALFITDGHCTDRGYGVMAQVVAGALR